MNYNSGRARLEMSLKKTRFGNGIGSKSSFEMIEILQILAQKESALLSKLLFKVILTSVCFSYVETNRQFATI